MMNDYNCFWGMGWFMWLIPVAIILIIVYALKNNNRQKSKTEDSPFEILKKRYAKGEITKQEFEEKKKDIES